MRVLFAARWYPSHDSPGRGSFVADQVRALTRAGVEVVVASWEPALLADVGAAGSVSATLARAAGRRPLPIATPRSWGANVPVVRLAAVMPSDAAARHPVDLATWQAATLVPFAEALASTWPIDVIHAHTGLPDGLAAVAAADRLGVPLVTTEHDGSLNERLADSRTQAAYRSLVTERRRLVAVSARLADQMAQLSGVDRSAIDVIPNLVELDLFTPDAAVARDPTELLWVGNRKASKGMHQLLEAFARVATTSPGLHLRLIGGAPTAADDADLRMLAEGLGIGSRVWFEPPAGRRDVAAAMARAGLFVHPSPTESFGIVAIEAIAAGLPVVAVAPTVIDHIGRDGALGEAAAGPDAESLSGAIERALGRLGQFDPGAFAAAARPFGEAAVADRIRQVYREAIGDRRSDATGPSAVPEAASAAGTLVVATRRRSLDDRLARLDPAAAATLTIVTAIRATAPGPAPLPAAPTMRPAVAGWVEVDADAAYRAELVRLGVPDRRQPVPAGTRRWLSAVLHPLRTIARRRLVRRRPELAKEAWASAVSTAASDLDPSALVLALDANDVAVIERAGLVERLVPVGLRWIADRHDAKRG